MSDPQISRGRFLRHGSCLAAATALGGVAGEGAASSGKAKPQESTGVPACKAGREGCPAMALRPYQLLCLVCSLGGDASASKDPRLKTIFEAIRKDPDAPITLQCNAGDVYVYQDPGTQHDTPEGSLYNRKRDLDILQRIDLAPGSTLPARTLLKRLLLRITSVAGLCGYNAVTSDAWKGCPKARSGQYEAGRRKGIDAIVPPRSEADMQRDKQKSLQALYSAKEVRVRPHILLCSICQYAGGARPPFKEDNLPELLELVLKKNPEVPITLVRGADWMMCAPCPSRVPELNACVCGPIGSGGLYNELKDLNVLQRLGLSFGATLKARELYRLILERIPTDAGVCALENRENPPFSIWWDPCGDPKRPRPSAYQKGREMLRKELS